MAFATSERSSYQLATLIRVFREHLAHPANEAIRGFVAGA